MRRRGRAIGRLRGWTLVEAVIALAILVLVAGGGYAAARAAARARMRAATLRAIAAASEDLRARVSLAVDPATLEGEGRRTIHGIDVAWSVTVESTDAPGILRITAEIGPADESSPAHVFATLRRVGE